MPTLLGTLLATATVISTAEIIVELTNVYRTGGVEALQARLVEEGLYRMGARILCKNLDSMVVYVGKKVICYTPRAIKEVARTCVEKIGDTFYKLTLNNAYAVSEEGARALQKEIRQATTQANHAFERLGTNGARVRGGVATRKGGIDQHVKEASVREKKVKIKGLTGKEGAKNVPS